MGLADTLVEEEMEETQIIPTKIVEIQTLAERRMVKDFKVPGTGIKKWATPIPKFDLPPRTHLQKVSELKQVWELWSMSVALAMSTWNDVAVTFLRQVYHQSEGSYQDWRRSSMTERFAYKRRYLYGRKAPDPSTCDAVEALLPHELLSRLP